MSNKKKSEQLEMSYGKAGNILRKSIMFSLAQKCNYDTCYRCKKKIENIDELSIEHIKPWLDSDNPVERFFDLNNTAFSHLNCNIKARNIPNKKRFNNINKFWCWRCKQYKDRNLFPISAFKNNARSCTECESKYRKKYRASTGKR